MPDPAATTSTLSPLQSELLQKSNIPVSRLAPHTSGDVDIFEVRAFLPSKAEIEFGGLGPCLGIIIRHATTGLTLAGHLPEPEHNDRSALLKLIEVTKQLFTNLADCRVVVAGCAATESRSPSQARAIQAEIKALLTEAGVPPSAIEAHWGNGLETLDVSYSLASGKITKVDRI